MVLRRAGPASRIAGFQLSSSLVIAFTMAPSVRAFASGVDPRSVADPVVDSARGDPYYVAPGDTLSSIAQTRVPGPIYGSRGSLARLVELNPALGSPDLLHPGEAIRLPKDAILAHATSAVSKRTIASEKPRSRSAPERAPAAEIPDGTFPHPEPSPSPRPEPSPSPGPISSPTPPISTPGPLAPSPASPGESVAFEPGSDVVTAIAYQATGLRLTDPKSGARSTLATGVRANVRVLYLQHYSRAFSIGPALDLGYAVFESPAASDRNLVSRSHFLGGLAIVARARPADRLGVTLEGRMRKELFGRAVSTNSVAVDAVNVPSVEARAEFHVARSGPLSFGIAPVYARHFVASNSATRALSGSTAGFSFYWNQSAPRSDARVFSAELGATVRNQSTSVIDQRETTAFGSIRFSFPFFTGSKRAE